MVMCTEGEVWPVTYEHCNNSKHLYALLSLQLQVDAVLPLNQC